MKATANSRAHNSSDPLDALKEDFMALRKDVVTLVSDGAKDRIGQASDTLKTVVQQTSKQAGAMHKQLSKAAAERPVTTILIAAAVGAIGAKALWWLVRR